MNSVDYERCAAEHADSNDHVCLPAVARHIFHEALNPQVVRSVLSRIERLAVFPINSPQLAERLVAGAHVSHEACEQGWRVSQFLRREGLESHATYRPVAGDAAPWSGGRTCARRVGRLSMKSRSTESLL